MFLLVPCLVGVAHRDSHDHHEQMKEQRLLLQTKISKHWKGTKHYKHDTTQKYEIEIQTFICLFVGTLTRLSSVVSPACKHEHGINI
jgi:hypothetical protein